MATKTSQKSLEDKLWEAADKLRGNQETSEYKHVVLGLVFLKYISDRFEERRNALTVELTAGGEDPDVIKETLEDRDEYTGANVFWVPESARWDVIKNDAKNETIGKTIDNAMRAIEKENKKLRGTLPRNYARDGLHKGRLGQLVDLIGSIGFGSEDDHGSDDILGRVYEYFLGKFAGKETGKEGGAFYTPRSVVQLLVEMLQPYKGRVYDPCCGSGGMFVQSAKFVEAHGGSIDNISVYGQEFTDTTWKLAKMNLALRGIDADLGAKSADSFTENLHPDLRADYIIANPPFNVSDYWDESLAEDPRWEYGIPRTGNANYAWIQHFLFHLAPGGTAGFVMAKGALSSSEGTDPKIRKLLVESHILQCVVDLPDKLFFNTPIPASIWFIHKPIPGDKSSSNEVLFIDARSKGELESRSRRYLTDFEIEQISQTFINWKSGSREHLCPGFSASVTAGEIEDNKYILTPGRYTGRADQESDDIRYQQDLPELWRQLFAEFERGKELEKKIKEIGELF